MGNSTKKDIDPDLACSLRRRYTECLVWNASGCLLEVVGKQREVLLEVVFKSEMMCENVKCIKKALVYASKCLNVLL